MASLLCQTCKREVPIGCVMCGKFWIYLNTTWECVMECDLTYRKMERRKIKVGKLWAHFIFWVKSSWLYGTLDGVSVTQKQINKFIGKQHKKQIDGYIVMLWCLENHCVWQKMHITPSAVKQQACVQRCMALKWSNHCLHNHNYLLVTAFVIKLNYIALQSIV